MEELVNAPQTDVHEVTPLLSSSTTTHNISESELWQPQTRCTWPWKRVVAVIAALIITANMADYLSRAPKIRLYESVICSKHWMSIDPSVIRDDGSVPEDLCKVDVVQDKLSKILGWQLFFDSIPAILLPIPYGYVADKYGRKWVLVAGIAGIAASSAAILFVVGVTNLPLPFVWLSSIFSLVGGGSTVATAILLTMVADVTPAEKRSITFFYLLTCQLVDECLVPPLTAFLMAKTPWIPLIAGVAMLILATMITVALPETLPVSDLTAKSLESDDTSTPEMQYKHYKLTEWLIKFMDSFAFATCNATVMAIIFSLVVSEVGRTAIELLLQYVSKRYVWSLSKAGLLLSLRAAVNIILFTVVLPLITILAFSKRSTTVKDLWIARTSVFLLMAGTFILCVSASPQIMIIGVVVYTLGTGFPVVLRSLVTTVVEKQNENRTSDVGRLYALISLTNGIGNLIAGPGLAWAFRVGIRLGQAWLGLPYAIATVLFVLVAPVVFMIRI